MKNLIVYGTTSSAGKSMTSMALLRVFTNRGYDVYPFKSQNMSRNFAISKDGDKMAKSQFIQAIAAKKEPKADMNPVLLVPSTDTGSEVYLLGESLGRFETKEYYAKKKFLKKEVEKIFAEVQKKHDFVVIEGAGSPAEINLYEDDFVNTGMAEIADAKAILVSDIDRGGVFASMYGTAMLIPPESRKRIVGFVINKFRGDKSLLDSGIRQLEELTGIPVIGIVPYKKYNIEDEDSLIDYDKKANHGEQSEIEREAELERLASDFENAIDIDYLIGKLQE